MRRKTTYIHERPDWPQFHWDTDAIGTLLARVRHRQGLFLGRMEELGFELQEEAGLAALTSEIVKSAAIEGKELNPDDVRSSIAERLGLAAAGRSRADRDTTGFVEILLDATKRSSEPLSDERLFGWQAALFPTGRSDMTKITVGAWRTGERGPMQVISGPEGKKKVHFEAPDDTRVPSEMAAFIDWFNKPASIDPVLKAGVAHFWFVTIHPFEDGNGRIARAIGELALARADQTKQRFYSMSTQIESERKTYYDELESAQRSDTDITAWLTWFLDCLGRAIERAEEQSSGAFRKKRFWERIGGLPINSRQRVVINRMLSGFEGFLSTSKYAKLAKCSTDTALRDIQALVELGVLVRNAERGRKTSYRLTDDSELGRPS